MDADRTSISSDKGSSKTSALKWFESHPLVATVLWALGTDVRETNDKQEEIKRKHSLNRSLSWRDDRGGSIVEAATNQSPRFADSNILHSTASASTDKSTSSTSEDGAIIFKRSPPKFESETQRDSFEDSSPNNNYGFYVTISPPQEHLFPRVPRGDDT